MSTRPDTISKILRNGESTTVDFKESFSREAIETLSAFANTSGGRLFLGVNDKGFVTGTVCNRHTLKDIANQTDQGTALQPSIKPVRVSGKDVIVIEVSESEIKPIMVRGRAYRRVGSTTRQMGVDELTRLILEHPGSTWDERPEPRADWSEISATKVKAFIRLANNVGRRAIPEKIPTRQLLEKLDVACRR